MAAYTYLPWVRQGLIGAVGDGTVSDGRLQLAVQLKLTGGAGATTQPVNVQLFGPQDVTGFDIRQIIRTEPPNFSSDFEPNYFPLVEFDRPDFPWLLTPAAPDGKNQLAPWLCLIVVERREGVSLTPDGTRPLALLTIESNAHVELPDLSEAWAWAHAQVVAVASDADLDAALKTKPERTLSRLMCLRRLKPKTAYFACVVPTYKGGVQAGLGEDIISADALDPAWSLTPEPPNDIRLPVYCSWEFSTGAQGDFESLVWELQRRHLSSAAVGTRKLDLSAAGYGLSATAPVDLAGALAPDASQGGTTVIAPVAFQQRLQALLNETTSIQPLPILPPPIYGHWHALQRSIPDPIAPGQTRDRAWLRTLNLDPCNRVAAGLGALIVRERQEQLMASAWDQVGDIERANAMLRRAKLARTASLPIHQRRFGPLDATTFFLMTAAVQPRIRYTAARTGAERTARGHLAKSALPAATSSAQFRRALRPRGAIARRFGVATLAARNAVIAGLNGAQLRGAPQSWPVPRGMSTMDRLLDRSPCHTNALKLAQTLVEAHPLEPLVAALDGLINAIRSHRADIATVAPWLRDLLERVAKDGPTAKDELAAFMRAIGTTRDRYLDAVDSLYRPAIALIVEIRWLLDRLFTAFTANQPPVVQDLDKVATMLPSEDVLRDLTQSLAIVAHLRWVEPCEEPPPHSTPPLDLSELRNEVHAKLDPATTIAERLAPLIEAPGWDSADLDFVLAAPDFPTPMYKALAHLSQDWLLPGLERVPADTVALLQTNPRFIEAFMVGLNHEMSRELLWRGYPTDQRGTCFRQFWDPAGRFPPAQSEAERAANLEKGKDIPPIHEWVDGDLGSHFGTTRQAAAGAADEATARVVLLIRGQLLRRYPRAMVYLARGAWSLDENNEKTLPRNPTSEEKYPLFRSELAPDIQLLGFDVGAEEAQGTDEPAADPNNDGAGWFVVLQQQPTEPRYGLDETAATSPVVEWSWRDLAWPHVRLTEEGGSIRLAPGLDADFPAAAQRGPNGESWKWASDGNAAAPQPDGAQIACITLQGPVRVAIHASDLF